MGSCSSCLKIMLDTESDVKIHVIEPTSIAAGAEAVNLPEIDQTHGSTLQVPASQRPRRDEKS